ncbi:hypothetical protein B0J17DRAFT_585998, partial [Rhizoctonia solani]
MPAPEENRYPSRSCEVWAKHIFDLLDKVVTFRPTCRITALRIPAQEISLTPYSASPAKREVIDKQIDDWLRLEVIEPSKSAWGFPVIVVYRNSKPR